MSKPGVSLKNSDFVHLHTHSQYSLLDGLTKIPALISQVKEAGMEAIALTDHGTMSGAIEFYKEARSVGLNPIIGMEAYIAPRTHLDKETEKDRQYFHLTMLAIDQTGYRNLMRLSTIANLEGFYYRPRIDHELLEKYNEGLIVLSGCMGGEVSDALRQGQYQAAKKVAEWYKKIFGDRYYIELLDHGHANHPSAWEEQKSVNDQLLKLSKELNISAVVTSDAHYLKPQDQEAHEILLCVQTGAYLSDEDRFSLKDFHLHVEDPGEIIQRWGSSHPELITNTKKIADRCRLEIELGNILIPTFSVPKGETEKSLLEKLVWQGLAWRYGRVERKKAVELPISQAKKTLPPEVIARGANELETINKVGFNGFFLIVNDFVNWGKDRGIVFGPGRGSTAGSIVAYVLRITDLNPLEYDLLFERFLTADRVSMPDMDIDIQDSRRDEVINYCIEKYGSDRVANIVTFGRMAARNSVRDVARVLQMPYAEADRLAKMIPPPIQGRHTPLARHLDEVDEIKSEYNNNPAAKRVLDLAMRLEGTIRSHGVHAAGVIIAPRDLVEYVPLEMAQKGVVATQYSMNPIEDLGLLKIDFLGLSNLTTIKNALRIVKKVYQKNIDIATVPLDDKKTYRLLQRGDTIGVFQLESAGMKRYLKQLKPTVFDDIIAMVALYRPGPMQWIEDFIARKHGQRQISYIHPVMEDALKSTYGVIVYQEQVMQISKDLAGFSGSQADTLRKGIGKKIPEVLAKMKIQFIEGSVNHSKADRRQMENFWGQLEAFASYAFPKAHAACYALIAYQTAYLKANYPEAFMAALMTSDYDNTDRLAIEIAECKRTGIEVLPPDINESFHEFGVIPGKEQIRFGMDAIKNVGHGAVEEILRAREELGGKFQSLEDFCKTVNPTVVNRKSMECLIKSGALDRFGSRSQLMHNLDSILGLSNRLQKAAAAGQVDLFGETEAGAAMPNLTLETPATEFSSAEQLSWERELLGLYLSQHPLQDYEAVLTDQTTKINELKPEMDGASVKVGGSITELREITTKNGSKMAFVKLADTTGEIELVMFPKLYKQVELARDLIVIAKGRLNTRDRTSGAALDELKVLPDKIDIITLETAQAYKSRGKKAAEPAVAAAPKIELPKRLFIRIENGEDQNQLMALKQKLDDHQGETEVVIVTGPSESKQAIRLPQMVSLNEQSLRDLAAVFGSRNVVVR